MRSTETADVAVIGLGAYGSATLYQLAKRGVNAIGIDRFHPPHTMGSSHGETRITRLAVGEGQTYAPVVQRSHEVWRELEAETQTTLMITTGGLIMAPQTSRAHHHGSVDFVRRSIETAESFGIPHEVLTAAEVNDRFRQFQLTGDELAYYEPDSGMLRPEECVDAQLSLAARLGARVRFDERVLSVGQQGQGVEIKTSKGTIASKRCVVTAGAWARSLVPEMVGYTRIYRQLLHWFPPVEPRAFAVGRFPVFIWMHGDTEEDYFYGFPTMAGTEGVKVATERYATTIDPESIDRTVLPAESSAMFDAHVSGRLRGIGRDAIRASACLYTVTPDAGFVVDDSASIDGVLTVSACSGHGFKHSAAIGEAIAERIVDGESRIDLAPFAAGRFAATSDQPKRSAS